MNWWLSSLQPPNKDYESKPTFGQAYLYASGYDDTHEGICYKDKQKIRETKNTTDLKINIEIASSLLEFRKLCDVFGLKRFEFLKMIANRSNRMEEILQFLNKNINGYTMICNIYLMKKEATIDYHWKSKEVTRQISKILLGHHIILCVPLTIPLNDLHGAKEIVTSLILKNSKGTFADYFLSDSVALIDYIEQIKKPAFEILNELNDYSFKDNISLFVELPKFERMITYNNFSAERAVLLTTLKLKRLNYLMEDKFSFESNFINGKLPMGMDERDRIAETIIENIGKLGDLDVSTFPPPLLVVLYNHCKVYEREYIFALYENAFVPALHPKLEENIDIAYTAVKNIPLKRVENLWLLKANDGNANEVYQKYLAGKWCIVITKNTKHLITEFMNGAITWVLTEETKWKESSEPVLIYNGVNECLLGLASPQQSNKKTCKNGAIFRCPCCCEIDKGIKKAWICTKCKFLFQTADDNQLYCDCGVFDLERSDRRCFKCAMKKIETTNVQKPEDTTKILTKEKSTDNEKEKLSSFLLIPTKRTPTSVPRSPTTEMPKKIVPLKKKFNILFIGQSGAGKSMLINSIYNYLNYDFEEVSQAETVDCNLPCQFQLQTPDFKKRVFKAGPEDENENYNDSGESVTQHPKIYNFKTEKYDCQIIDTPGLGDTRGAKQDEYNLNLIRNTIIGIKELHAICFIMPSNISKQTQNFNVHMCKLFTLFPKTALKNIFFFFTFANSTFFTIGDTRSCLEEFISTFKATNNAEIPFSPENVCCVDSEAFMYFIATKQGHKYQNRDLESFKISWDRSKAAIETFLGKLENVFPIKSADILMTYELEQIGRMLRKENNDALKNIVEHILITISQISMTSKFNLAKKPSIEPMNDSQKLELFLALDICQKHVVDPNLKQLIKVLIDAYATKTENKNAEKSEYQNGVNAKRASIESNKSVEKEPRPDPPKRIQSTWPCKIRGGKTGIENDTTSSVPECSSTKRMTFAQVETTRPNPSRRIPSNWPCMKQLKKIAEKVGKEWQNGKISKNLFDHMLNVQIAANLQNEDVNKAKLINSFNVLLADVNSDSKADIENLLQALDEFSFKKGTADALEDIEDNKMDESVTSTHLIVEPDNHIIFAFPKSVIDENAKINAVGIDLGTSRCCIAVNRKNGIETVGIENVGERLLPSYVSYDEEHTKCGQVVVDRIRNFSTATVFDSKRIIGKTMVNIDKMWPFKVVNSDNQVVIKLQTDRGEIEQTATQVAAELLKYMKNKAEQFQGKQLSKVVITVPAAFNLGQEEATREAAIRAGWETVTLLPEPIAASFAYFIDRQIPNNSNLLLFDLGGGTLDVCVFKIVNDQIQIISKNGDSRLGGRDFDNLLMDYFGNKLSLDYDVTELGNKKYKLLAECQKIKHNLSVRNDDQLDVEDIDPTKAGFIKITQQNFQDLAEDLLNKIKNTIFSALYKSRYTADKIDKVLQVGGGCRMQMIKKLLQDTFPNAEHCCEEHPDEVVAIGAAYYAYNIFSEE